MAAAVVEDFLTCAVCLDTFKEPVSLGCHHSFCYSCLKNYWDRNNTRICPVCKRKSSKENLGLNFAIKELCISFTEEQKAKAQAEGEVVCSSHPDVLPVFCKDEGQALCPVCEFTEHKHHTVASVKELKEQLESQLHTLRRQREEVTAEEKLYEEMAQHSEKQVEHCERHIRVLFGRLQQFLRQEEERALSQLREEQQRQAQSVAPELDRIRDQLSSLSQSIQALEKQLHRDTGAFLTHYSRTQRRTQSSPSLSQPRPSGLLINQVKVLGNLGFRVWNKMKTMVQCSPVILDPNTANRRLSLSEDLTSVGQGDTEQQVPVNPERFTNMAAVLGSEALSSGTHQWEVKVGDHPHWAIGVAKESVDRQEKMYITPEYGIWCLWHGNGAYTNGCNRPVPVTKHPTRIRVELNFNGGKVSFYDADDMTLLYTHKDTFTEKLLPLLSVGMAGDANTKQLQICACEAHGT